MAKNKKKKDKKIFHSLIKENEESEKNNFKHKFSYSFDDKHFDFTSKFSLNKIFKKNDLQDFLFFLHKNLYMFDSLTIEELRKHNKILNTSFEKLNKTQINTLKKDPSKKEILKAAQDNKLYQIPLGDKPRLFGFFIKSCFHIVAYDPEHEVFPTNK